MIEKIYAYSEEKKILKKYAFLPPLTATNRLTDVASYLLTHLSNFEQDVL